MEEVNVTAQRFYPATSTRLEWALHQIALLKGEIDAWIGEAGPSLVWSQPIPGTHNLSVKNAQFRRASRAS